MEIAITNYRNIANLGISLEDGKVNFLLGVCGSGKSSILDAISRPVSDADVSVGCSPADCLITVNGESPSFESVSVYNLKRQGALFKTEATKDSYEIFIGDESELRKLENSFNESISQLRLIRDQLFAFSGRVDQLVKSVKKPTPRGYTPKSPVGKAYAALTVATPTVRKHIDGREMAYLDWQGKGFTINNDFIQGKCPFCGQKIEGDLSVDLQELHDFALKDLKPLFQAAPLFKELNCTLPDVSDEAGFEEFKLTLDKLFRAQIEINKVIAYTNVAQGSSLLEGMPDALDIDSVAYEFIPELEPLIAEAKNHRELLTTQIGKMRGALTQLVRGNARQLNRQLDMLGIPYAFKINEANRDAHTASYILTHVASTGGADMRHCLSYGEQNLIALVLFLHNNEDQLTLVDDPASSYDDFRRSQIYRCIMQQEGKTVLVVSHDQAFTRRAMREINKKRLGLVAFLENSPRGCRVKPITSESFVFIDDEIYRRISTAGSYFQKIMNVRLLCDIHKQEISEALWGYVSAILHGTKKKDIEKQLSKRDSDEATVLGELRSQFGIRLEPLTEQAICVTTSGFSQYEALIYARELYKQRKDASGLSLDDEVILDMLNDLVHMNDCALHCLNPYEYAVWPKRLSIVADEITHQNVLIST